MFSWIKDKISSVWSMISWKVMAVLLVIGLAAIWMLR